MQKLVNAPRGVQALLGGTVLYVICSFLDWQQVSVFGVTVGQSEWHGVGVMAGLLAIALLAWEVGRLLDIKVDLGSITPGMVSVALAFLLALFTVITFADHSEFRHWPEWLGLITSLVIATTAIGRARAEGVKIPTRK